MNRRQIKGTLIFLVVLLMLAILLFYGSVLASIETHDPIYIIFGYPLTGLLLVGIRVLYNRLLKQKGGELECLASE